MANSAGLSPEMREMFIQTMKQVFEKALADQIDLHIVEFKTGEDGFSVLSAKKDYALVEVKPSNFHEDVQAVTCIHPYGSNIGYNTEASMD